VTLNSKNRGYASSADEVFFTAKVTRDARCVEKDAITKRLFERLSIDKPRTFTALLMPSMFGPEVEWLCARGVRVNNVFAIERNIETHAALVKRGLPTSPKPMLVQDALDHVPFEYADLVYLDFFGQPNGDHIHALRKLFKLYLQRGSRLWVTFGVNRGKTFSCSLNRKLKGVECAGEAYIRAAHALVDDAPAIRGLVNHRYKTSTLYHPANFILTEVRL
jgi:hypothetical protein